MIDIDNQRYVKVKDAVPGDLYFITALPHPSGADSWPRWAIVKDAIDDDGKHFYDKAYYPNSEDPVVLLGDAVRIMGIAGNTSMYFKALTPEGIVWLHEVIILFSQDGASPNTVTSTGEPLRTHQDKTLPDGVDTQRKLRPSQRHQSRAGIRRRRVRVQRKTNLHNDS